MQRIKCGQRGERAPGQKKPMKSVCNVPSDDLASVVDPTWICRACAWKIDRGESARTHQESMRAARIGVVPHDLPTCIDPLSKGRAGTRRVDRGKGRYNNRL